MVNRIEAINGQTKYMGEHLVIAVDGVPLDQLLHTVFPNDDFEGLVPTLLGWMSFLEQRTIAWERFLPPVGSTAIAPLLICPDDLDFGCTDLVAEVIAESDVIRWNRLGEDRSLGIGKDEDLGTEVEWLSGIGPFDFSRTEYERCREGFRPVFYGGEPFWQVEKITATVFKSGETRIALQKILGDNRSHARMRSTAEEVLSVTSITVQFLLRDYRYEDFEKHSIPVALIPQLRQELQLLRNHTEKKTDQILLAFVRDMEELAEAALREGNPIYGG